MPFGTLDRDPPPFFRQGPSALSKLAVCSALALFLMVADSRFKVMQPLRVVLATVLYPVQWLALQPVLLAGTASTYFTTVASAESAQEDAAQKTQPAIPARQPGRAAGAGKPAPAQTAGPVAAPGGSRQGRPGAVRRGRPVHPQGDHQQRHAAPGGSWARRCWMRLGVIGQVTRVYPPMSEVTLITDRDHAIPVLNARTGARGVAFGDTSTHADALGVALHGRQRGCGGG